MAADLVSFDLNLLLVFNAVLETRSVSRAAEKLGLSQPALSHALNRLRWRLKDQLFVRTPQGMSPTPRAERLAEPVRRTLADLQRALTTEPFVPEAAERCFTVSVNNYAAVVLVGPVFGACKAEAPGVRLDFRPSGAIDQVGPVDRGERDLAIVNRPPTHGRLRSRMLVQDAFVGVVRKGHPATGEPLTAERLSRTPHLVISSSADNVDFVEVELVNQGLAREVAAQAPFLSAGAILAQCDMLAVMGRGIAEVFSRTYPVEIVELPIPTPKMTSWLIWHSRYDDDDGHAWLRDLIVRAVAPESANP